MNVRPAPGIYASESQDRGASWTDYQRITPEVPPNEAVYIVGQPVRADGTWVVPHHWYGPETGLALAIGAEVGGPFEHRIIAPPGDFFPTLSIDGSWQVVTRQDDRLAWIVSDDGVAWSEPTIVDMPMRSSPWFVGEGVAWIHHAGGTDYTLQWSPSMAEEPQTVATFEAPDFARANTDMAHGVEHQGRPLLIHGDNGPGSVDLLWLPN